MIQADNRFIVVDALRGLAIVAIMLLHNIEHFDFYVFPENQPEWLNSLDTGVWEVLFFLFASKAYAMFALLFGLTYYIQTNNQIKRGGDFRLRFAWRMLLLFAFGMINSMFIQGDILSIYAVLGLLLIPVGHLNSKWLLGLAIFFLLLPVHCFTLISALQAPDQVLVDPASWALFGEANGYKANGSFIDAVIGNLTIGKRAVLLWNFEEGRYFMIYSLFLFGILAGRLRLFADGKKSNAFWRKALPWSLAVFVPLFVLKLNLDTWVTSDAVRRPLATMVGLWSNTAFMVTLVAGFTLAFKIASIQSKLNYFSAFGKMSLSNYLLQSIVGSFLYYGFGLGLYQYTGASKAALVGLGLVIVFGIGCSQWAKRFKRGPFEEMWHKLTWLGKKP